MRDATSQSAAPTLHRRRAHPPKVRAHDASAPSAPRAAPPVPRRNISARNYLPLPSARSRRRARIREGSAARSGKAARTDGAWAANDQDRLISYGPFDYTYTANGELETKTNRDTDEEWIFDYDELGNLLAVGLPNGDLVEYLVDGLGRRVGKKKNGALLKQWIYRDTLKPVAELDGSGALVSEFVYGSKSNVPDYVRRGGATYRVVSDHLGSPRYVVNVANSSDAPVTTSYTSFGEVAGTGLDWMPFGFAGGMSDADSGLVRFGARDHDPTVGRWVSKDPLGWGGGQANLYAYSLDDPNNRTDPSEMASEADCPRNTSCGGSNCFLSDFSDRPCPTCPDIVVDGWCTYLCSNARGDTNGTAVILLYSWGGKSDPICDIDEGLCDQ
jgi:RHS repeat-associated protein